MHNQYIYTPFFLERPAPKIEQLVTVGGTIIKPAEPGSNQLEQMSTIHTGLRDAVYEAAASGRRPVSVAGDCCTVIGVLAGLQRAGIDPVLIWLDAHGDLNTWETTPSGFIGGMPLAMMIGHGDQTLVQATGLKRLAETDVVLSDGRDLDPGERDLIARSQLKHVIDVAALLKLDLQDRPLHIHFDTDLLNPNDAPAMAYRAAGGASLELLEAVAAGLAKTGNVASISMTVWDMERDTDKKTQAACMRILEVLVGDSQ